MSDEQACCAGLNAEIVRLEALVVTRTEERDRAVESAAAWAQAARDLSARCEKNARELAEHRPHTEETT